MHGFSVLRGQTVLTSSKKYIEEFLMEATLDSIRDIQLYQSKTGYRFSVDALLLFDFVDLKVVRTIADLGAGSGIVGILLAKKYHYARVVLYEIQPGLASLAGKNILINNMQSRMKVVQTDITDLSTLDTFSQTPDRYDLVVTNPPFRKGKSGLINIDEERAIARHELKISLRGLIDAASHLLKPKGRFCIIYHPVRLAELIDILRRKDIEPKRVRFVHSSRKSEAKMVLLEAVRGGRVGLKIEKPLYIYDDEGNYTNEMKKLYNPS
jgi:tRNA1Val (adenine37-N6)-methyltransferase